MPKYWAHYAGNFAEQSDEVHEQFGFFPVVFPEYNPQLQTRGEIYWDEVQQVFTYPVSDKVLDLEELKAQKQAEVTAVVEEISQIISTAKNLYDPWRDTPEAIPQDFKDLVAQRTLLLARANAEIDALTTVADAVNYIIRGPEVEAYIDMLKQFTNTTNITAE